jgi:hypothetical protein
MQFASSKGAYRDHAPQDVDDGASNASARAPFPFVTTKGFLSQFGLDTLRDLPDVEKLEEAGLLSKDKLLAGELPESFGITKDDDISDAHHTETVEPLRE